jgi:hypothetical protein
MADRLFSPVVSRGVRVVSFRRIVAALLAVALLAAAGCGDDDDDAGTSTDPGGGPSGPPTTEPPTTEPPTTAPPTHDDGCFDNYPIRLEVSTDWVAEVPYLDEVAACTTSAQDVTAIANHSDMVWTVLSTPAGALVHQYPTKDWLLDRKLESFREAAAPYYQGPLLLPDSVVVVEAEPASVKWTLAPGLSAMWQTQDRFVEHQKAEGVAQGLPQDAVKPVLINLLSGSSLRRKAILTCLGAAFDVAGKDGQGLVGPDPGQQFIAALGILKSGMGCGKALLKADEEAVERRGISWGDEAARWVHDLKFRTFAKVHFPSLRRIGLQLVARAHR